MENIIKPSDLKNDLDKAEKYGDIRLLFLYSNLYNEYFVDLLYKTHIGNNEYDKCSNPKCQKFLTPKFKQQVERLSNIGVIDRANNHDSVVNLIFDIRNQLSHELECNIDSFQEKFEEIQKNSLRDDTGVISKAFTKMNSWQKIKLSVFAVVTAMYKKYEEINDRKPKQSIVFKVDKDGTKAWVELVDISTA